MKKLLPVFLISFAAVVAIAQKHDNLWFFGADFSDPDWGFSTLDFDAEPPLVYEEERQMNLDVTFAGICDSMGNLQFYTNGAWIAGHTHQMMENGDSLNPGQITWTWYNSGLPVAQSHIILPMPDNPGKYYLFHERLDYHDVLIIAVMPFYYTVIDMHSNNNLGKVLEKNVIIFDDPDKTFGTTTAVKHANGRDWWVLFPEKARNVFYRFLFSPNGVEDLLIQNLSPPYPFPPLLSNAFIAFSPDGGRLARYEVRHGLYLYDFDRCTGLLSDNPLFISIPDTELGGGVAFSPNGRFIYMLSSTFVLQADTWAADIASSIDTVAVYDGFFDPNGLPTRFFTMQPGPDGRIYFNTTNGTRYLHYIDRPNMGGEACRVVQHGIELPYVNNFTSPHFPNYRLGPLDGSPCDTLGLDNHPLAGFRYEVDSLWPLRVEFIDNSFYEPAQWQWDFGDGSAGSSEVDPVHIFPASGIYTVCLTVSNQYDSDPFCRVVKVAGTTGVEEPSAGEGLSLFPNPARNSVTLRLQKPLADPAQLAVINLYGQVVARHRLAEGMTEHTFPVDMLPQGIYLVRIRQGEKSSRSARLVVAR